MPNEYARAFYGLDTQTALLRARFDCLGELRDISQAILVPTLVLEASTDDNDAIRIRSNSVECF
jgi:hypothetical protein